MNYCEFEELNMHVFDPMFQFVMPHIYQMQYYYSVGLVLRGPLGI